MNELVIDTGVAPQREYLIPAWFIDQMPEDISDERLAHQYAYHLIGKISEYKSMKFARLQLIGHWQFLRSLADSHPEIFDEVIAVYAEKWASEK